MNLTSVIFGVLLVISSTWAVPEEPPVSQIRAVSSPPEPISGRTVHPEPTTTPEPETTTTPSPKSTTPSPKPSSSPAPKPSPTPAPSTTPASSTTPEPTPAPSTTPQPTPTPAPKPSPKPVPKEYYWNVSDAQGQNCILAKANIKLELTYTNQTSNDKEVHQTFSVPPNATSSGQCGDLDQILQLAFGNASTISFTFSKNNGTTGYGLSEVRSSISLEKENNTISLISDKLHAFQTQMNTSYECSWSEPSVLKENDAGVNITKATLRVVLSNIQVEAFRNSTNNLFSQVYSCSMDSPDIVPIMVGIALGILVAVVLIAYLVGRRSTQAQGYLSM